LNAKLHVLGTDKCNLLIVEPWAEEIELVDDKTYELTATADDQPWFEVEPRGNTLLVHVNGRRAIFELSCDGKVVAGCDVPTPT